MKPHRLTLTNALVMGYGLDKQIHNIYDPRPATQKELENYHDHDYIEFLSKSVIHVSNFPIIDHFTKLQSNTSKSKSDEANDRQL